MLLLVSNSVKPKLKALEDSVTGQGLLPKSQMAIFRYVLEVVSELPGVSFALVPGNH